MPEGMRRMKRILRLFFMVLGLLLIFYPWVSNWLYERQAGSQVKLYEKKTKNADGHAMPEMLRDAKAYNRNLNRNQVMLVDPFTETDEREMDGDCYQDVLNLGDGLMGYIEIPSIGITLPVFHGTGADVLEHGVGHLKGSSLPVGGKDTHTVLTGHTGLSHARMFTDLVEMKRGDVFFIRSAGRELCYKVSAVTVVLPDDTEALLPVEGKDLATLVTCTPYGVNSHRLFVTGERTRHQGEEETGGRKNSHVDSPWMFTYRNAVLLGILLHFALDMAYRWYGKTGERRKSDGFSSL